MALDDDRAPAPCSGPDLQTLVRQVFDGEPPIDAEHQAHCQHCQQRLTAIQALHADTQALAAQPVATPDLVRKVMAQLRRQGPHALITTDERGTTTIAHAVVATIARQAAMAHPAVAYASVDLGDQPTEAGLPLSLRLVVAYGPSLPHLSAEIRAQIIRDVETLAGVPISDVTVLIDDLT
jgi:uncharacterized alkaline shock family protein YloU